MNADTQGEEAMSSECRECENNVYHGHAETCSRFPMRRALTNLVELIETELPYYGRVMTQSRWYAFVDAAHRGRAALEPVDGSDD